MLRSSDAPDGDRFGTEAGRGRKTRRVSRDLQELQCLTNDDNRDARAALLSPASELPKNCHGGH